jgi:hypothetical protein
MTTAPKTRVFFVLDDSGSIENSGITKDVHQAFNNYLTDFSEDASQSGDDVKVTLYLFGHEINREFWNVPAQHLKPLERYAPNQHKTKLFEATVRAIKDAVALEKEDGSDIAVLIIVITDGHNNDFKVSAATMKSEIEKVQRTGRYTMAFMLPPGSKRSFCREFGISEGNVTEWEPTRAGVAKARDANKAGITNYLKNRRSGVTSTGTFYSDMSNVSSQDVRKALNDVSGRCVIMNVLRKERMDDLCRREAHVYVRGCGFYQLVKTELVQSYKKIIIMEKGKTSVYYGPEARDLLGLPNSNTKVTPGDHANFLIFVQSTADNRAPDPGTQVVYYHDATIDK